MAPTARIALRGAVAGVGASLVQSAIGKTEELFFLPSHENANIAPRLADRVGRALHVELSNEAEWVLGTAFHLGYGATWGTLYALMQERLKLPPLLGGLLLGSVIYGITFPRWGMAVKTGTERPPVERTRRMGMVALSVAFGFGLATAMIDRRLEERAEGKLPPSPAAW